MEKTKIIVITGLMASGKSTIAELLAKRFEKAVHLRGDVYRKMIVSGRVEMGANPTDEALRQLDLRYKLTAMTAIEYYRAGFTVVVQDNYYGEKLPFFLSLLEPEPVQAIVLCPNADVIRQRENSRGKRGYTGFDVADLYDDFMTTTPRIGTWIDNSDQTPEETVEEIWKEVSL